MKKNTVPGGCVATFTRKGYRFETTQIIPDVSNLLSFFDVNIPLCKFDNYYARLFLADTSDFSSMIIPVPSSREGFEEMMIDRYPEEKSGIESFFSYCQQMYDELDYLKAEPKWSQIPLIL